VVAPYPPVNPLLIRSKTVTMIDRRQTKRTQIRHKTLSSLSLSLSHCISDLTNWTVHTNWDWD